MKLREYIENEEVINFYACGKRPYNNFSNFSLIEEGIMYDDLLYYSTEHAFQSQKYIKEQRYRFSVNGDLGNVESGFKLVFGDDYKKKKEYWMKKNNIGIIAKMATKENIGEKLGLIRVDDFVSNHKLWLNILSSKFNITEYKNLLLSTNDTYLLEFDRGAQKNLPKWSGIIKNNKLYGENLMGNYLMIIRKKLKNM